MRLALALCLVAAQALSAPPTKQEKKWGITPVSLRPAADGYLLYFRYRVVDAARARALFDSKVKPSLVDRSTGAVAPMPEVTRLGALRASPRTAFVPGKEYYVLFTNPSRAFVTGTRVDVVLGDLILRDLEVAAP